MIRTTILALLLCPALAACASDPGLGDTVRANVAAMTVPPQQHTAELEGGNGRRGTAAVKRYLEGRVVQPVAIEGATPFAGSGPVVAPPADAPRR